MYWNVIHITIQKNKGSSTLPCGMPQLQLAFFKSEHTDSFHGDRIQTITIKLSFCSFQSKI